MPANDVALKRGLETAVRQAGEIARVTAGRAFEHWTKGRDRSPVSEADIAVNDFLRDRLTALEPAAGWLSEETEDDPAARAMRRTWIVDPIDGTRAFIQGRPDWTVSVALVEDGRPILAALYAPVTEEMYLAEYGRGATHNGTAMRAADGPDLTGIKAAGPKSMLQRLKRVEPTMLSEPKVHSLALRLTRTGTGKVDVAFASDGSHDWDLAAADLLVHEAGGVLTDLAGRPLSFNRPHLIHGPLLAAGPGRHGALLALLCDLNPAFA